PTPTDDPRLLDALTSPLPNVRCLAALRIGEIPVLREVAGPRPLAPRPALFVAPLAAALRDADGWTAHAALAALTRFAPPDRVESRAAALVAAPRAQERLLAPFARRLVLALAACDDVAAIEPLRAAVADDGACDDDPAAVRGWALAAYAHAAGRDAIPFLRAQLTDRKAALELRIGAARALGRLGAQEAAPDLAVLARQPAGRLMVAAAAALAQLGDRLGLVVLAAGARDPDPATRAEAESALIAAGSPALPVVLPLLLRPEPAARAAGSHVLGEIGEPEHLPALDGLAHDPEESVRVAAAAAAEAIRSRPVPRPSGAEPPR
ncbi:MAG: HEAT repeat domain-containing protein, partial [Planctomycetes bacterium]|nr:HEAT repeat domain-containing protein [Planctomycetota bacterium]